MSLLSNRNPSIFIHFFNQTVLDVSAINDQGELEKENTAVLRHEESEFILARTQFSHLQTLFTPVTANSEHFQTHPDK